MRKMQILIRVDSSIQIGSGHLMRCLTLAGRLYRERNAEVHFICRDLPGKLSHLVSESGYRLHLLPRHDEMPGLSGYASWLTVPQMVDAAETVEVIKIILGETYEGFDDNKEQGIKLLVVDNYALDETWERELRPYVQRVMVIDDLANRKHDCDILLDQNFHPHGGSQRYERLVPEDCRLLLGPRHVLLREEFYEARKHLIPRDGKIRRILVFYGGVDLTDETGKAVRALMNLHTKVNGRNQHTGNLSPGFVADLIVGDSNPQKEEVRTVCAGKDFLRYHCQVDNMADFMAEADLMLGAAGTTTWERCYLGLPAIVTSVADNQHQGVKAFADAGYIYYLGRAENVTEQDIAQAVMRMTPERLASYGIAGESLMDVDEERSDEFFR